MERDEKLEAVLQSYTVKQADEWLVQKMVAKACQYRLEMARLKARTLWRRTAAMAAAVAVVGFFCGCWWTDQAGSASAVQSGGETSHIRFLDTMIFGPDSYNEVTL